VALDFSKAQRIASQAPPVKLDFSRAQPIPPGASVGDPWAVVATSPANTIPPNATIGAPLSGGSDEIKVDPHSGSLTNLVHAGGAALEGLGEGIFGTLAGGAHIINKIAGQNPGEEPVIPTSVTDKLNQLAGGNDTQHGGIQQVGTVGESIAEFLMGDAALKGMGLADKIKAIAPAMKAIEKSPTLAKVVGGLAAGGRAGLVQGAQTTVKTGGDVGQAAEDAGKMGLVTAGLGALGAVGSGVLGAFGSMATKAKNLAALAEGAASKPEVTEQLANRIEDAKNALHEGYETGIQDLNSRLGDTEISAQENPLAEKAQELLTQPDPEEHPLVTQAKAAVGEQLKPQVRKLLEGIATGETPAEAGADLGALKNGVPGPQPEGRALPPYKIQDLVQLRQTIRKLADGFEPGDVNARALRSLIREPMDDTIGNLAEQSGDANAVQDYANLRQNYASKIDLFDDPVIRKIRDGKVDDAAKDFVGVLRQGSALPSTGKTGYNLDTLRGILGDDGMKAFGRDVFGNLLKDSIVGGENGAGGRFNPARFVDTWKRITPETKQSLFDSDIAGKGLAQLASDAGDAARLQHLTRAGLLVGAGTTIGHTVGPIMTGLGGLLGFIVGESGGLKMGREMLDYVATHPTTWNLFKSAGEAATSDAAAKGGEAVLKGAQGAVNAESQHPLAGYSHLSPDGKFGWDGTQWVPLGKIGTGLSKGAQGAVNASASSDLDQRARSQLGAARY